MACTSLGLDSVEPAAGGCQSSAQLGKEGFVRSILSARPLGQGGFGGKGGQETGSVGCFSPSINRSGLVCCPPASLCWSYVCFLLTSAQCLHIR